MRETAVVSSFHSRIHDAHPLRGTATKTQRGTQQTTQSAPHPLLAETDATESAPHQTTSAASPIDNNKYSTSTRVAGHAKQKTASLRKSLMSVCPFRARAPKNIVRRHRHPLIPRENHHTDHPLQQFPAGQAEAAKEAREKKRAHKQTPRGSTTEPSLKSRLSFRPLQGAQETSGCE